MVLAAASQESSLLFLELGIAVIGLALLARVAGKLGFSAIPLYLLAGLAFGNGGLVPLRFGEEFVRVGAEVGVVLLLFMLGVEYTPDKLVKTLRTGVAAALIDLVLNFAPGVIAAQLMGMSPLAGVLLGGVTYSSSSGIIAKVLGEIGASGSQGAAMVVRILVLEDVAMAVYLPVVGVLLTGKTISQAAPAVLLALATVAAILWLAVRFGSRVSKVVNDASDEVVLLTTLGLILFVSGVASKLQVSSAIGAFLVGVAISGSLAVRAERLISPLRDLFAATFFLFFGLQIDPASLPPALPIALALAVATGATKVLTGWWIAKRDHASTEFGLRAGVTLAPRGEFSIVIAGLGAGLEPRLGPLAAAYVLILAVAGPLAARWWGVTPRTPCDAGATI